jgi:hypothetical protein
LEFPDLQMEVLYHKRPDFVGTFSFFRQKNIGLRVGTSTFLKWTLLQRSYLLPEFLIPYELSRLSPSWSPSPCSKKTSLGRRLSALQAAFQRLVGGLFGLVAQTYSRSPVKSQDHHMGDELPLVNLQNSY